MLKRALLIATSLAWVTQPASAQFYKGQVLTLLVNYAAGGNADAPPARWRRSRP